MKSTTAKMINTDSTCTPKAILPAFNHWIFPGEEALKKETAAMMDATKESIVKKWPSWPANKCSPSKFITAF